MRGLTMAVAIASLLIGPVSAMAQGTAPAAPSAQPGARTTTGSHPGLPANKAGHYQSESAARQACGSDTVVWVNTGGSKAWHVQGDKYFGHTKHGAYMCEQAARQAGYHAAGRAAHASRAATKPAH